MHNNERWIQPGIVLALSAGGSIKNPKTTGGPSKTTENPIQLFPFSHQLTIPLIDSNSNGTCRPSTMQELQNASPSKKKLRPLMWLNVWKRQHQIDVLHIAHFDSHIRCSDKTRWIAASSVIVDANVEPGRKAIVRDDAKNVLASL
jgi:hypothetical protein